MAQNDVIVHKTIMVTHAIAFLTSKFLDQKYLYIILFACSWNDVAITVGKELRCTGEAHIEIIYCGAPGNFRLRFVQVPVVDPGFPMWDTNSKDLSANLLFGRFSPKTV